MPGRNNTPSVNANAMEYPAYDTSAFAGVAKNNIRPTTKAGLQRVRVIEENDLTLEDVVGLSVFPLRPFLTPRIFTRKALWLMNTDYFTALRTGPPFLLIPNEMSYAGPLYVLEILDHAHAILASIALI